MPEALQQVRDDFGENAVILNTRQLRRNSRFNNSDQPQVEVTAAVDEIIPSENVKSENFGSSSDCKLNQNVGSPEDVLLAGKSFGASEAFGKQRNITRVEYESSIKKPLQGDYRKNELKNMELNNTKNISEIDQLCNEFRKHGITQEIINNLLSSLSDEQNKGSLKKNSEVSPFINNWFKSHLPECRRLKIGEGKQVIGFLGSAGAGKTTAIAKIAGSFAKKRKDGVVIISTDNRRIGALDQLEALSHIIGVRFETAFDEMEMQVMLDRYEQAQLVLIDAPGYGCRDEIGLRQLKGIYSSVDVQEVHLVMDATNDFKHMMEMIEISSIFPNRRLLFTKTDQVSRVGTILSATICSEIPTSYISNSNEVKGGIEPADMRGIFTEMIGVNREQVLGNV
jgi:flagellar biosynthesis protein FlhF